MPRELFITATDTDAGKTLIATALIAKLVAGGNTVAAFKPVSAGCELVDGLLVNDDAKQMANFANAGQGIQDINPIAFKEPIAPHIAAQRQGQQLTVKAISHYYQQVKQLAADYIVVEGAGGWRLPLGHNAYLSGFVAQEKQAVVLVVGMKLGCLNHAILTYESIVAQGIEVVGWVANAMAEMDYLAENIALLKQTIQAPLLAELGFVNSVEQASEYLDITPLLSSSG
jgi:dethiobiotin synthetase